MQLYSVILEVLSWWLVIHQKSRSSLNFPFSQVIFASCCVLVVDFGLAKTEVWLNFRVFIALVLNMWPYWDFPGGSGSKASAYNAGDPGSIPMLGKSPGEGNGNPLQYSCLEIPWTEEPGRLQSMGSQRIEHNWAISLHFTSCDHNHLTVPLWNL